MRTADFPGCPQAFPMKLAKHIDFGPLLTNNFIVFNVHTRQSRSSFRRAPAVKINNHFDIAEPCFRIAHNRDLCLLQALGTDAPA